jgi:hypothetical protein
MIAEQSQRVVETGIPAFRIEGSELLYMTLGGWVVSFEGYKHNWDNKRTLGPARGKHEWCGAKLGLTEQCDFDSNNWHSSRFDFEKNGYYFDNSMGDYPFCPTETWEDQYMLWEFDAWKKRSDNFWEAKGIMEESVWKQLTNPYNNLADKWSGRTTPLDIIKAQDLTQDDLHLETIYLYIEFDSVERKNEAVKEYHIDNLQKEIERIEAIPYGKGI